MKVFHTLYKIINLSNGRYYIGMRSNNLPFLEDRYMGSGKAIRLAIKKHGRDSFIKGVIETFDSREDLNRAEVFIVNEDVVDDNMSYNLIVGGGCAIPSKETRDKISKKLKGRNLSKETRAKMKGRSAWNKGVVGSDNSQYGVKKPKGFSENMSVRRLGKGNPMFGKKMSKENKELRSARWKGESNPRFGKKYSVEDMIYMAEKRSGISRSVVLDIYHFKGSHRQAAVNFNMKYETVYKIRSGRTWQSLIKI